MLVQILIATLMIVITVVIEAVVIAVAIAGLNRYRHVLARFRQLARTVVTLSLLTLWLMAGIGIALVLWSLLFLWLGEFDSLHGAIYFSSVSATTLGYGDSLLSERWQLLSGFIAANGLVLFSLNTAFLFEVLRRINQQQPD